VVVCLASCRNGCAGYQSTATAGSLVPPPSYADSVSWAKQPTYHCHRHHSESNEPLTANAKLLNYYTNRL